MSQLLALEVRFLENTEVQSALRLNEVRSLQTAELNAQKKKFTTSLELSKLVKSGAEWFATDEAKQLFVNEGLTWTIEDFFLKVYNFQKSYAYKLIRVAKFVEAYPEKLTEFNRKCTEAESNGQSANRTVEGLLKFAQRQQIAEPEADTTSDEGDIEASEDENGAQELDFLDVTRPKAVITFTFKLEGETKVNVTVNDDFSVNTRCSREEILNAIDRFRSIYVTLS